MNTIIERTSTLDQTLKTYDFLRTGEQNPYNFVGVQHNQCLRFLMKKGDFSTSKLVKNAFTFIKQNDGGFIEEFDKSFEEKILLICDNFLSQFKRDNCITVDILNEIKLKDDVRAELFWLVSTILNFDVEIQSFVSILEQLNNWEYRINNSNYTHTDKVILLSSSAVARHSTAFWTKEYNLELEGTSATDRVTRKKKCLRTAFTICADVIGAVGGAVAGTVAGGPVGGVIGGVATSGAMSGAANAIFR